MTDVVNVGAAPNDGTGDALRQAMILINAKFAQRNGIDVLNAIYLGSAAADPVERGDESALQEGDWYINTVDNMLRVYLSGGFVVIQDAAARAAATEAAASASTAQAARDSSFANAKGADTISAARALVADDGTFIVYAAGAATYRAYRRTSSTTEVYLGEFQSKAGADESVGYPVAALRTADYTDLSTAAATSLFAASSGYADFARALDVGTDLTEGVMIDGVSARVQVAATVATVRVKLWARALTDTATTGAGPGQAGDTLLETVDYTPAAVGIIPGAEVAQQVFLPLTRRRAEAVSYIVELDARDESDARAAIGVMWGTTSGQSQRRRGYFRATTGASSWSNLGSTSTLALNLATSVLASAKATDTQIKTLEAKMASLGTPLIPTWDTVAWRYGDTGFAIGSASYAHAMGFVGGVDVAAGTLFSGLRIPMILTAGADAVAVRLWSRPVGASWAASNLAQPGDHLLAQVLTTPAALGITPGAADFKDAVFELPAQLSIATGTQYYIELEATQAGTRVRSAVRYLNVTGLTTDQYRKFWRSGAASSWSNGVTTTTWVFAFDLVRPGFAARTPAPVNDGITAATATVNGSTVTVDFRAARLGSEQRIQVSKTIAAPAGGTVTDDPMTLTPAGGAAILYSYLLNRTDHTNLVNLVVKDAVTLAPLAKGTDYWVIEEFGCFSLPGTSGAPRAVLLSYGWSNSRYDQLHYTPATGAVAVTAGTERDRDAAEFIPATPAGALPLFNIHVRAGGNVTVPVWDVTEYVRADRRAEADRETERNRRLLRSVLRKLVSESPVTVMSYGDSNFAQMGGGYSLAAVRSAANTIYHDRTKDTGGLLLSPAYGSDVLATIPTYDNGDGAGTVHTRFGFVWELIRALQAAYGSTITYKNRSIPGTNSTNSTYHGRDSTRLAAATADAADFVLVGFGANELGQTYTRDNIIAICQAFQAAGIIPVVVGCARPNALDLHGQHTTARWHATQRQLREAAYSVGCPYFGMEMLYADGEMGTLGLSVYDACAGTKDLHPGILEHKVIGARMAEAFL